MKEIFIKIAEGLRARCKIDYITDNQLHAVLYALIADCWAKEKGVSVKELEGFDSEVYLLGDSLEYVPDPRYVGEGGEQKLKEIILASLDCQDLGEVRQMLGEILYFQREGLAGPIAKMRKSVGNSDPQNTGKSPG
jgi:hypothetical protein